MGLAKPLLGRFKSGSDFGHVVVDVALDKREVAARKDDAAAFHQRRLKTTQSGFSTDA